MLIAPGICLNATTGKFDVSTGQVTESKLYRIAALERWGPPIVAEIFHPTVQNIKEVEYVGNEGRVRESGSVEFVCNHLVLTQHWCTHLGRSSEASRPYYKP